MQGQMIEVKHRAQEDDHGEDNHYRAYRLVDDGNAIDIKFGANLVYQPRQTIPPEQRSQRYAQKTNGHIELLIRPNEGELREDGHEEKDDKGIGKGNQEGRQPVVQQRALGFSALMHLLLRVRAKAIKTEEQQDDRTGYL